MTQEQAIELILIEILKAQRKHPVWPKDIVHATAILAEEAGEAMKAANDVRWHNGVLDDLRTELAHTGAMAIRCLMNLGDE